MLVYADNHRASPTVGESFNYKICLTQLVPKPVYLTQVTIMISVGSGILLHI